MNRIRLATLLLATALLPLPSHAQFPPAPGTGPGLPETIEAIDDARVTTRILYITAHPDDEPSSSTAGAASTEATAITSFLASGRPKQ